MTISRLKTCYIYLSVLVVVLIALGGAVRAMDAGLACPDWPLCFGQIIPDYDPKVYFEFFHRVLAGLISIITVILSLFLFRNPEAKTLKMICGISLAILVFQVVAGGLTVLKMLQAEIVTIHLFLGTAFFLVNLWIVFSLDSMIQLSKPSRSDSVAPTCPMFLGYWFRLLLLIIYIQVILGGTVSSHYAGLVCPDFPLCLGQWIPTFQGAIGKQVLHRLGAYITTVFIFLTYFMIRIHHNKGWMNRKWISTVRLMCSFILLQLVLGIANIKFKIPPLVTVLHLVVAILILSLALRLVYDSAATRATSD